MTDPTDDPDQHDARTDEPTEASPPSPQLDRRRFLRRAGVGVPAVLAGGLLAREVTPHTHASAEASDGISHQAYGETTSVGGGGGPSGPIAQVQTASGLHYGQGAGAPPGLVANSLDAVTFPPPRLPGPPGKVIEHELIISERSIEVAAGVVVEAWTYGGTVPGPILRGTVGDTLRVNVVNRTSNAHNLHLHGRHDPQMDGWEPIPAGSEFTYEWVLGPAGVHPYHCHTAPLALHVSKGLYGTLIVDPVAPREPAHEVVLMLSGWDTNGDGANEIVAYNGVAGFFSAFPIKVPVGELVRAYVLNMTEYEPVASFHLHAETFDVYRSGTGATPDEHTDTVTMSQGERAMLEFRLSQQGRYMFHPHQHHLADAGAMGWFAAV